MITTAILTVIWGIVRPLLVRIPDLQINYAGLSSMSVYQYFRAGLYFFPMGTVVAIFEIIIGLWVLRIVIAILHSLWAALPIV